MTEQTQSKTKTKTKTTQPNVLMIIVDQLRFQPEYGDNEGFVKALKNVLNFKVVDDYTHNNIDYDKLFPGFSKLRKNSVIFNQHRIASSACVASRSAIFTGQYGTITGVTQTDGIFKDGADASFPWLKETEHPTIGDWMIDSGYSTHYFGKWHISGEDTKDLEGFGFSDWDLTRPDPHGSLKNNLGYYRDYQFRDLTTTFLRRQGLGYPYSVNTADANVYNVNSNSDVSAKVPSPWFTVSSFANPHDIACYPGLPSLVCDQVVEVVNGPIMLKVPHRHTVASTPTFGTMKIKLNQGYKDGSNKTVAFPQDNAALPPEELNNGLSQNNKPSCQQEYAYKMGLALGSLTGLAVAEAKLRNDPDYVLAKAAEITADANLTGIPFELTSGDDTSKDDAKLAFLQYYGYLIYEVDKHIDAVLTALEESGQDENTIVIFCADHGEYGASHGGMMEKWHSAYEEVVHVPMVVRLPEQMRDSKEGTWEINELTSHIDLLPTILGLTKPNDDVSLKDYMQSLQDSLPSSVRGHSEILHPVGADLSGLIKAVIQETSPLPKIKTFNHIRSRDGILFMTYDTITEPLEEGGPREDVPTTEVSTFDVYMKAVDNLIAAGKFDDVPMTRGVIKGPNQVHCVVSKDNDERTWKFVRYLHITFDSVNGSTTFTPHSKNNEYELYELISDPTEQVNLLKVDCGVSYQESFSLRDVIVNSDSEFTDRQILAKANEMVELLTELETDMLQNNKTFKKRVDRSKKQEHVRSKTPTMV